MNRALVNRLARVKGHIEGEWVEVASSDSHVHASENTNIIGNITFIKIFRLILTPIKLY